MNEIVLPTLSPRKAESHKGDYGKVLVIAGSEYMIGAAALVAMAAFRAGAGLVRIAAPKEILPHVLTVCPFATGFAFAASRMKELLTFADQHDALAVGPGLGLSPGSKRLVLELIERHQGAMVFDADALNVISTLEVSEWPKRRDWSNIVLTPHMGEYMRLVGAVMKRGGGPVHESDAAESEAAKAANEPKKVRSLVDEADDAPSTADGVVIDLPEEEKAAAAAEAPAAPAKPSEPDRTPLAELLARGTGTTVVLKGDRSIVCDGYRAYTNTTGNPAMATAGSGDVLTGTIAALLAGSAGQRLAAAEAAALGVFAHGRAGDLARDAIIGAPIGGLTAMDIAQYLPRALAERLR